VRDWAASQLAQAGVAHCEDGHGNLVVGASSLRAYQRLLRARRGPLPVLIAHMDHPGFQGQRWLSAQRMAVRWHGGGPRRRLAGARVWLAAGGQQIAGTLHHARLSRDGTRLEQAEVRLVRPFAPRPPARTVSGGLDFRAPSWISGQRIYTRAADDLVGVFAIVESARRLAAAHPADRQPEFIALLTRAEEVGFIGAIAHLEDGWLQSARRPLCCVSLEASSNRPGALPGKGPVIRLGDRQTVFSADANRRIAALAATLLPGRHQQRLMDGGTCEATATLAYGLPTGGLAIPLGNYHNQNLDGGQDTSVAHGPAPEFVDRRDIAGMLALCTGLTTLPWDDDPWQVVRKRLVARLRHYRRRL
jgi:endoglucanase